MRPRSIREVAVRASHGAAAFADACHEFLDAFYLLHGDRPAQEAMLREAPRSTGDAFRDAWIGAMAEHLAQRWNLSPPGWAGDPIHDRLSAPVFVPDSKALRGYLLAASPPAFRARLIFTGSEPLQRARFPRDAGEIKVALPWPPRAPANRRKAARSSTGMR